MSKYLFFDLDGTLLGPSRQLHPDTRRALLQLHQNGHKIFLCSGRSPAFLEELFPDIPFDGIVGCAGGCIVIDGETVYENNIEPTLLHKILDEFAAHNMFYAFENRQGTWQSAAFRTFRHGFNSRRNPNSADSANAIAQEEGSSSWKHAEDFDFEHLHMPKMTFHANSRKDFEPVRPLLEQHFHVVYFHQEEGLISGELIDPACTKADGVRHVLERFGGDMADTIGFGDSMNDYQMIEAVHTGVVAECAPQQLKDKADLFFIDPDQGGIALALEQLGLVDLSK